MNVLCEFDKAGAEWVVVAYLTGDTNMLDVVQSGRSPHTVTGALMSGLSEETVAAENKIVGSKTDPDEIHLLRQEHMPDIFKQATFLPRSMSIRQAGKKSNHGLNYNMRFKRYALENEIDETEAKSAVHLYRTKAYPGLPIWHEAVKRKLRKDRTLVNCFNRKRVFMEAWGEDLFDAAFAFLPQSTVFDVTRIAMTRMMLDMDEGAGYEILAQVHDSIQTQHFDVEKRLDKWARDCYRIATEHMNPTLHYNGRDFRLGTTMKVGVDWSQEHMHEVVISPDIEHFTNNLVNTLEMLKDDLQETR